MIRCVATEMRNKAKAFRRAADMSSSTNSFLFNAAMAFHYETEALRDRSIYDILIHEEIEDIA